MCAGLNRVLETTFGIAKCDQSQKFVIILLQSLWTSYSVFHKSIAPSKELRSKMAHDDATPLSFWLQVTEDFFKSHNFFIMEK